MTNGNGRENAAALVSRQALRYPYRSRRGYKPVLNDIPFDISGRKIELRHAYSAGGVIHQVASDIEGYKMKVIYKNMPLEKVRQLDIEMDGKADLANGRIRAYKRDGKLDMVFYSNPTI